MSVVADGRGTAVVVVVGSRAGLDVVVTYSSPHHCVWLMVQSIEEVELSLSLSAV